MKTCKFKVGDKVRILPSAIDINVVESEIGKTGVIIEINSPNCIIVDTSSHTYGSWIVGSDDITSVIKKGQQLLFPFMEEGG